MERFAANELVLGIDLGTTNSAACCVVNGQPVMIDLRDPDDTRIGVRTIPSVVAFDGHGDSVVGRRAVMGMAGNPRLTIAGSKRFIGRQYDSPFVQQMLPMFPYKVVQGSHGEVAVDINGRFKSLAAISAYILSVIHQRAEAQLKQGVRKAVITVPAYYNDNQRDAVVQAGRMAGLEVIRILNEPTAAAIAYGLDRQNSGTILVYDLGGGTFDVSVMRVERGKLTVLSTAGDTFLGGEDFDAAIMDELADRYQRLTGKPLSRNGSVNAELKAAVEQAKRRLSSHASTLVKATVTHVDRTQGKLELPLERTQVERLVEPLIKRTLSICDEAIAAARVQITDVVMVGGQTVMPAVRQRVEKHFGKTPRFELNPDEAVALGAGLLTTAAVAFTDVLPMTIGINWHGAFQAVIMKNTPVPYRRRVNLKVAQAELRGALLELRQGDTDTLAKTERLGAIALDSVAPGAQDPVPLAIDFALTGDCLLHIRLTNTETAEGQTLLLNTRIG